MMINFQVISDKLYICSYILKELGEDNVPVHVMKTYRRSGGAVPLILTSIQSSLAFCRFVLCGFTDAQG
jgi:hypothetical protein